MYACRGKVSDGLLISGESTNPQPAAEAMLPVNQMTRRNAVTYRTAKDHFTARIPRSVVRTDWSTIP